MCVAHWRCVVVACFLTTSLLHGQSQFSLSRAHFVLIVFLLLNAFDYSISLMQKARGKKQRQPHQHSAHWYEFYLYWTNNHVVGYSEWGREREKRPLLTRACDRFPFHRLSLELVNVVSLPLALSLAVSTFHRTRLASRRGKFTLWVIAYMLIICHLRWENAKWIHIHLVKIQMSLTRAIKKKSK